MRVREPAEEVLTGAAPIDQAAASDVPDLESTVDRTIVALTRCAPFVSLGRYRYLEAHEPLPPQRHRALMVLVFPIRGTFVFVIDDETVSIAPGHVLCIRPGVTYRTGVTAQTRGELLWLVVDTGGEGGMDAGLGSALAALAAPGGSVWPTPGIGLRLLEQALSAEDPDESFLDGWRRHLCGAAVFEVARDSRAANARTDPVHAGVRRAQRWIHDNLIENIRVSDLVQISGMSSTHFYQQFMAATGTSPKDYVLRSKIDRAQTLLHDRRRSITMVAHELGFGSSQHFGTAFRRYTSMSPSEYRARLNEVGHDLVPPAAGDVEESGVDSSTR